MWGSCFQRAYLLVEQRIGTGLKTEITAHITSQPQGRFEAGHGSLIKSAARYDSVGIWRKYRRLIWDSLLEG